MSAIAAQEPRLNDEITTRECRLIDFDGNQMGVYPTHQAQQIADDMNLDLVEIAPNATPPVCRIMDYGKFKYDQAIKAKQEDLQKAFYAISEKLYQQANPQGAQGGAQQQAGPDAGAQQGQYYDADYKVVDDDENNKK